MNSVNGTSSASVRVTVGLTPPLRDAALSDPPIPLRFWDTPSQSQALDCANGASGWNNAMQNGCPDPYQIYDQAKHVSACGNPPSGVPAADPADCIASKNGNFQQNGVTDMFDALRRDAEPLGRTGYDGPAARDDPRWMPLFILDELAFTQSGKKTYPIRRFGMFYVTAVSGLNCPGDDPVSCAEREEVDVGALRELRHARIRRHDPGRRAVLVHRRRRCASRAWSNSQWQGRRPGRMMCCRDVETLM